MSKNTIYDKTNDYIQDLLETEEVKSYKKANDEFEQDNEAKKLLSDFQEVQRTYNILSQGGFKGIDEQAQKLRDLDNKLSKNHKIQALIKSQHTLQLLVDDLAGDISKGINFPFTQPQRGGCCG